MPVWFLPDVLTQTMERGPAERDSARFGPGTIRAVVAPADGVVGLAVPGRAYGTLAECRPDDGLAVTEQGVTWSPDDWPGYRAGRIPEIDAVRIAAMR